MVNTLPIHKEIISKLKGFVEKRQVPNLLFYGPNGAGKKTIVAEFIAALYGGDVTMLHQYTMFVDCDSGKGIKFIREDLKNFAQLNLTTKKYFKSIVLINADKLTVDAQSALRRCIELFSGNSRFFVIVNETHKLLKPILSRFSHIYIPYPTINNKAVNLHTYTVSQIVGENYALKNYFKKRTTFLKNKLATLKNGDHSVPTIVKIANDLYQQGFSGEDIIGVLPAAAVSAAGGGGDTHRIFMLYNIISKNIASEPLLMKYLLLLVFRNREKIEMLDLIKYG